MKFLNLVFLFCFLMGVVNAKAQEEPIDSTSSDSISARVPLTYSIGVGLYAYRGDIGFIEELGTTENLQPAYQIGAEYKITSSIGINLNASYGSLVKNEKSGDSNRNFKSVVISGGLSLSFHFANGFILAENYDIDPFISIGFDVLSFNPKTDLVDANGNTYFYWGDGSIRNVAYENPMPTNTELYRDYEYETDLISDSENKIGFAAPISLGFNFSVTPYFKTQLKQTVSLTNTDFLDGHIAGKADDVYMFSSMSLIFNPAGIVAKKKETSNFENIDFVALLKADTDADGVLDIDDKCNDTEDNVQVDRNGCPEDKDKDGIPDHMDDEINTDKNAAQIDTNGVAISDSTIAREALDSLNFTLREELCIYYPSMCQGDESDIKHGILNNGRADKSLISARAEKSKKPIEDILKICDTNADGKITSEEIYESIDNYFDGKVPLELGDIHKLIDFYFEQ